MPWIAITKSSLYEARVAALIDACDTAAKADGQDDRSSGIIQGIVNEVRAAVASHKNNDVDADTTTIPESLRDLAVDMIIARLKGSLEMELTKDESENLGYRRAQLKSVAAGDLAVDQPANAIPSDVQGGTAVELIRQPDANPFSGLGNT
jgi:hypothetical protein